VPDGWNPSKETEHEENAERGKPNEERSCSPAISLCAKNTMSKIGKFHPQLVIGLYASPAVRNGFLCGVMLASKESEHAGRRGEADFLHERLLAIGFRQRH